MIATLLLVLLAAPARPELAPGARYDARIPTLLQVAGHEIGDAISTPEQITAYLEALAKAAPERTRLAKYAETWEGRPLHVLAIGSAERMARLDEVKADLRKLGDPRGLSSADGERLVKDLPAVTWLLHGVHGNEISSCDAALALAHHLLAAQDDAEVAQILRDSIVLIDPSENPDGRARFLASNRTGQAATPDPEPVSLEHDEPWPGGRSNHYLFDLNRDWFALSQPETRGRVRVFLEWFPQVTADLHEMGGDSTYYFAPPADPLNPYLTPTQKAWWQELGQAIAGRFDARGFPYFVREVFDSFYPGYGESWPLYQGAIGMTFEQASSRGLVLRRSDDSRLTYRDGVVDHFTAALTTAATAAKGREKLLRDFLAYRRSAMAEAEKAAVREYLLLPGADASRATRLADVLVANGIEVRRADEPLKAGARTLPAGTYVVSAVQPSARMVRNLLEAQTSMDEAFVKEQDRRRKMRLPDQVYDITAWSLPTSFDVECMPVLASTGRTSPYTGSGTVSAEGLGLKAAAGSPSALPPAKVAYLLPWGSAPAAAVGEALRSGLKVRVAEGAFTLGGRDYAAGTAIFRASDNDASLADALGALARRHGLSVQATDSGYVDKGISLGSNQVRPLKAPRVLLAWDAPTQSLSAGWARYVLERRFGQPVTAVRVGSLRRVDLARYDVLVLPSGDYSDALGEEAVKRLKTWVTEGGTLVLIAEAARWAGREKVGLLATQPELRDGKPDAEPGEKDKDKDAKKEPLKPFDYDKAIQPERERPEDNYGAILRVVLDRDHWLTAGMD
ncbi:MAG TPA: M14 family metallopeptidase, partial [Vicinamibacteria bacterium]|nr:M14 family metallopeptidase [Vicinamibacteria bacterium]